MRQCSKCGIEKDLSQFGKNRNGLRTDCKACVRTRMIEWEKNNPDKVRIYNERAARKDKQKTLNKPQFTSIWVNKCHETGKLFITRQSTAKYSKEGHKIRQARNKENYPSHRWPKSEHKCIECYDTFIGTPQAKYCSKECSRKHGKRIARMVEKVKERGCDTIIERVDPVIVFEKYNWRCAICNRETPRSLLGQMDDLSPTIDHILPISAGGEHSYDNTQLLCRECNMAKGAMIDPPKEIVQLITVNNQLNKQIYVTEQQLTRSA